MLRVIAQGGLGNQLFILAEAISLVDQKISSKVKVCLNSDAQDSIIRMDGELLGVRIVYSPLSHKVYQTKSILRERRAQRFPKFRCRETFWVAKDITDRIPADINSRYSMAVGFFQMSEIAELAWPKMSKVFDQLLLSSIKPIKFRSENVNYSVVHIRRGDYLQNKESYGVLSTSYYKKVREMVSYPLLLTTDDMSDISRFSKILEPELILGPSDLGNWEALELMSSAKQLFAANSTLSWWAGFIGTKKNQNLFLPSPWFKNAGNSTPQLQILKSYEITSNFE